MKRELKNMIMNLQTQMWERMSLIESKMREIQPILEERKAAALAKENLILVKHSKIVIAPADDTRSRREVVGALCQIIPDATAMINTVQVDTEGRHTGYGSCLEMAPGWTLLRGTEPYPYNTEVKA